MRVRFDVTGSERKDLVQAISEITNTEAEYLRAPTFAYQIGEITVDRDGTLSTEDEKEGRRVMAELQKRGYEGEEEIAVEISFPADILTPDELIRLQKIIHARDELIQHALQIGTTEIRVDSETITFPWFQRTLTAEESKAYTTFLTMLVDMAKRQTRVKEHAKEAENEKYAFRCFLLRLGMIGPEYKTTRKILLQHLSGSTAFKHKTS